MNSQPSAKPAKPKSSRWKKIAIRGCSVAVLCVLCILGLIAFALWGGGGEPATFDVANRVPQEFVQAIHDQRIDKAHAMLSEKFSPQVSEEQFAALIQGDERIFSTYKKLDICDWGFFISDGRIITASGLLYYYDGAITVEISLHKDSDTIWRVQGFRFRSDIEPEPFGYCQ